MKLLLLVPFVLMLGLAAPLIAVDGTAPQKDRGAAKTGAKAKPQKVASASDKALAQSLSATQTAKLIGILNYGSDSELGALPGIGSVRAHAIKTQRPFLQPTDMLKVTGIGPSTYKNIIDYAKGGFVAPPPGAKARRKSN